MVAKWSDKYKEIAVEFGYNMRLDYEAGIILDSILDAIPGKKLASLITGNTVFVIGAGTSLNTSMPVLKKFKGAIRIAADSAAKPLLESGIIPDVIVTDLDGDADSLKRCGKRGAILVVHAHGDNISRLHLAAGFEMCMGTTQSRSYGSVRNFGGFTDGDRAVFLAGHFRAKRIILLGMDYDGTVGRLSETRKADVNTKLKKLAKSKKILEWFSDRTSTELLTTSTPIRGFRQIKYRDIANVLS